MILERSEVAAARLPVTVVETGIEGVQAEVGVAGAIVEKSGVENVLGRDVVLQAEEIVAGPFFRSVGTGGLVL